MSQGRNYFKGEVEKNMKKFEKRKNILKEAGILLIVSVLLFSNLFASAHTSINGSTKTTQDNELSSLDDRQDTGMLDGYEVILSESFKDSTFPSDWTINTTNSAATWQIEPGENLSHSPPYNAICYNNINLQDEWLVTPSLNLKNYTIVRLSFFWMTDWWIASSDDECDLNVSISTDGGNTWGESLWCEDKYANNPYDDWDWNDTDLGDHIDLSEYANESNVKIRFQYYSEENIDGCQIWLDDVEIYGRNPNETDPLICNANGPYEGKAGDTIFFNGDAEQGQWPYIFRWDFGDNSTYNYQQNPTHRYMKIGTYNVTLRVTDISLPRKFDINYTTVNVTKPDPGPSRLNIQNISGGLGVKARIKNNGADNLTNIEWEIYVRGGPLGINIFDKLKNGTIDNLGPGELKDIRLVYYIGFGIMHVRITAVSGDIAATPREKLIWKWGPIMIPLPEI